MANEGITTNIEAEKMSHEQRAEAVAAALGVWISGSTPRHLWPVTILEALTARLLEAEKSLQELESHKGPGDRSYSLGGGNVGLGSEALSKLYAHFAAQKR